MTSVGVHVQKIKEHLEELQDAINIGIEKRPATIGMHVSAGSTELLETWLHKTNRIPIGKTIKHEWFKRPRPEQKTPPLAEQHLGMDFPKKTEIFNLLYTIEESRNKLIYGKPAIAEIEGILAAFREIKALLLGFLVEEGIEIEG